MQLKRKGVETMEQPKMDWIWHYVSNHRMCECCGKVEDSFPQYICDAHTHGMEKYGQLEFQVVLDYGPEECGRLLNTMGCRVRDGERFKNGDKVEGLYLDCDVQLREMKDAHGNRILRLIIPDKQNRLPEESVVPHSYQMLTTELLYHGNNVS